jgi:hypothetical protein
MTSRNALPHLLDEKGPKLNFCHCERSAAIHDCAFSAMDRRASLAMTNQGPMD